MRTLRTTATLAAAGLIVALTTAASAQLPPGTLRHPASVAAPARPMASPIQAWAPAAGPGQQLMNAYGDPIVSPAQYCGPVAGGGCYGDPMGGYGPCAGGGYGMPGGMDPFGGAYLNTEQCGPHWFDFSAEYLFYRRDDSGISESTVFSTNGFANDDDVRDNAIPAGQVRLRLGDPITDELNGYRLTGRIDIGAMSVAEFSYSGLYAQEGVTRVNDPLSTELFSIYSLYGSATNGDFGEAGSAGPPRDTTVPVVGPPAIPASNGNIGGDNFEETANALRHTLTYDSELHNVEASYRRYWVGANPRVSGTFLIGFRYTSLSEAMGFHSFAEDNVGLPMGVVGPVGKTLNVVADADNELAGVQVGGDVWVCVVQGVRIGVEGKVGLYGNNYEVSNAFAASDGAPAGQNIRLSGDQVSFLTEWKVSTVIDVAPSVSLKAGYEVLFISDLALVGDSLASAQPYGDINNIRAQSPIASLQGLNSDGDALFHGFHAGMEFVY